MQPNMQWTTGERRPLNWTVLPLPLPSAPLNPWLLRTHSHTYIHTHTYSKTKWTHAHTHTHTLECSLPPSPCHHDVTVWNTRRRLLEVLAPQKYFHKTHSTQTQAHQLTQVLLAVTASEHTHTQAYIHTYIYSIHTYIQFTCHYDPTLLGVDRRFRHTMERLAAHLFVYQSVPSMWCDVTDRASQHSPLLTLPRESYYQWKRQDQIYLCQTLHNSEQCLQPGPNTVLTIGSQFWQSEEVSQQCTNHVCSIYVGHHGDQL